MRGAFKLLHSCSQLPGNEGVPVLAVGCAGKGGGPTGHVSYLPPAELHVHFGIHLGVTRHFELTPGTQLVAYHAGKGGGRPAGNLRVVGPSLYNHGNFTSLNPWFRCYRQGNVERAKEGFHVSHALNRNHPGAS